MPFDATPTNTTAAALRRARALIDSPEKWCTGKLINDEGRMCLWGALNKATHGNALACDLGAIDKMARLLGTNAGALIDLNNSKGHVAVMAAFDRAIELAEAEG